MCGGRLWLTALGRDLPSKALEKHRIKQMDRLLGNELLQGETTQVYAALASWLLRHMRRPLILVDWTGCGPRHWALTAAVVLEGRAVPVLTRVCNKGEQLNQSTLRGRFLDELGAILPPDCVPVIITDAGFMAGWFEAVLQRGWHFIGRVRALNQVCVDGQWRRVQTLHASAGKRCRSLGELLLARGRLLRCHVLLSAKPKPKGRGTFTRVGRRPMRDKAYTVGSQSAKEPLVLATSLKLPAREVIHLYRRRMQIEESFRDLKSHRHGWCLEDVGCRCPKRIDVLLLIGALANVATCALGIAAETGNLHHQFQANTTRSRRVLSRFTLGRRVIAKQLEPPLSQVRRGFAQLRRMLRAQQVEI